MSDIGPILDSYIDEVIKANGGAPDPSKTQGADLRALIKLLRDRLEQEIADTSTVLGVETTERIATDTDLQNQIRTLVPPPNYLPPRETLSPAPAAYEIGQVIDIHLSSNFDIRNGGPSTSVVINKNGSTIASGTTESPLSYTDSGVTMTTTAISYVSQRQYAAGPVLPNPTLGFSDNRGQIQAGTATSNTLVYQGYYYIGYGGADSRPANNADVRALPQHALSNQGNTFDLATGTHLKQYIILPPGKAVSSATDLSASGAVVTYSNVANITVNDLSGNAITYTIWERVQGTPYDSSHTHRIITTG